jgi:hypothetical protein
LGGHDGDGDIEQRLMVHDDEARLIGGDPASNGHPASAETDEKKDGSTKNAGERTGGRSHGAGEHHGQRPNEDMDEQPSPSEDQDQ